MQHRTYSRQIFSIVALLGCILFIGGCCLKTVQALYTDGSESSGGSDEEVYSSSEESDRADSNAVCNTCDQVNLSNDQCELIINFCTTLNKVQHYLANYISTPYARGPLTEKEAKEKQVCISNCMFQLVSVAFNGVAKLEAAKTVLTKFLGYFTNALAFVSELKAAQIVPNQFVEFFSYILTFLDRFYDSEVDHGKIEAFSREIEVGSVEILERLIVALNKAEREWLKEKVDGEQEENKCSICCSHLKGSVVVIPCHTPHLFHDECIRVWIDAQIPPPSLPCLCKWCRSLFLKYFYRLNKPSCPLCRRKFIPSDLHLIADYCQAPT